MTLLVKDANTTTQPLSTVVDVFGNLVPVHAPSVTNASGIASPITPTNPLPVSLAPAAAQAIDGSGTIATGGVAQVMFGGTVPINGFTVANNSAEMLYASDVGTASSGGSSIPIAVGAIYTTPDLYRPAGAISIYGGTTGQAFAARRW